MKRTRNRRMYVNLGARASRLYRAQQRRRGLVFTVGFEFRPPLFIDRKTFDALVTGIENNPDTHVSEIQVHPGVDADVAAQFARLDGVIESLDEVVKDEGKYPLGFPVRELLLP